MFSLFADFKFLLKILDDSNELDLNYYHGHHSQTVDRLNKSRTWIKQVQLVRYISFFKFGLANLNISSFKKKIDCLFYISSINQSKVLRVLYDEMKGKYRCMYYANFSMKDSVKVKFSVSEYILALCLFFFRIKKLKKIIKAKKNSSLHLNKIDLYLKSYFYLVRFNELFKHCSPKNIVISNDHNLSNRCLIILAQSFECKTIFLPHGSGTYLLPPILFNYSLLEGEASVLKYFEAERKQKLKNNLNERIIFLKGNHKKKRKPEKKQDLIIGVAVSELESLKGVAKLIKLSQLLEVSMIIRTHPHYPSYLIEELHSLDLGSFCTIQDSNEVDENTFFNQISFMIGGSTSMHLDAALRRVPGFYYEFETKNYIEDANYHVKKCLIEKLPEDFFIKDKEFLRELAVFKTDAQNIKYFCDTYNTKYENKELDLALLILEDLIQEGQYEYLQKDLDLSQKYPCFTLYRCEHE